MIDEIRAFDAGLEIVVVDDGSARPHGRRRRARAGAHVLRLPFNLGIGGAVQTGFRYAFENGFDLAVRVDGDGQHDPAQLDAVIAPVLARRGRHRRRLALPRRAATATARRRRGASASGSSPATVSLLTRQRVTDPTSGFQALNRQGDRALRRRLPARLPGGRGARDGRRATGCACCEVPVEMRRARRAVVDPRRSRSVYYMVKVLLALFVGSFRRNVVPLEDEHDPAATSRSPPRSRRSSCCSSSSS